MKKTVLLAVVASLAAGAVLADQTTYTGNGSWPDPSATPGPQDHDQDGRTPGKSGQTPAADGGANPHGKVNPTRSRG